MCMEPRDAFSSLPSQLLYTLLQVGIAGPGIPSGRIQVLVSGQQSHPVQGLSDIDKALAEGVPEHMRAHLLDAGLLRATPQRVFNAPGNEDSPATPGIEHAGLLSPVLHPLPGNLSGVVVQGNSAVLDSLPPPCSQILGIL